MTQCVGIAIGVGGRIVWSVGAVTGTAHYQKQCCRDAESAAQTM
jgi:hypothetical protein